MSDMQEPDFSSAYGELKHSAKNAVASVHFRFYCTYDSTEQQLLDSVSRSWNEIISIYPDLPVNSDFNNNLNFSLFPISDSEGFIESWEDVPIDVYQTGSLLHGEKPINESSTRLDEGAIKNLYQEQFVVRLSFYIMEELEDPKFVASLLHNVIQSADLPGAILLSMQWDSEKDFPLNLDDVIPDTQESYSYQPIMGLAHRQPDCFFSDDAIGILMEEDFTNYPVDFFGKDKGKWEVYSSISLVGDNRKTVEIQTRIVAQNAGAEGDHTYGKTPSILGIQGETRVIPFWTAVLEGDGWFFSRHIQIPLLKESDDIFYASRGYPASSVFGDRYGSHYNILLLSSKSPVLAEMFTSGFYLERDVSDSGNVFFLLGIPQDDENDDLLVGLGGEVKAEEFFSVVNQRADEGIDFDELVDIIEELNGDDEGKALDLPPKYLN